MLEILALWMLCSTLGKMARAKGRKAIGYQVMAVCFWFGGEILGGIVGAVIEVVRQGPNATGPGLMAYVFALCGAAAGAAVSYLIVKSLPPLVDPYAHQTPPQIGPPPEQTPWT